MNEFKGKLEPQQIHKVLYEVTNNDNVDNKIKLFQTFDGKFSTEQITELLINTKNEDTDTRINVFQALDGKLSPEQISAVLLSTDNNNANNRIKLFQTLYGQSINLKDMTNIVKMKISFFRLWKG